jgi:3-oxoacyl-[acyl-carrier-protein] synthase II
MKRRVVITGLATITAHGFDVHETWEHLKAGRSAIRRIEKFDTAPFTSKIASEVRGFEPERWMDRKLSRKIDLFSQYGVAASKLGLEDAAMSIDAEDPSRVGAVLGSGIGGIITFEEQYKKILERGPDRCSPFFIPRMMVNAVTGHVAITLGINGPNFTVNSACASSNHAIGTAYRQIAFGDADVMITGGTEAAMTPVGLAGFCSLRALSCRNDEPEKASRPFDRDRDGFVMGEGCGVLILEDLEHARKRDARIYAELIGFSGTNDGFHITEPQPDGSGAAASMKKAMADAGINAEDVSYINAHGTSTALNDPMETKAMKIALGDYAYKVAISSSKSMLGHLLGASGALEAAVTALSVHEGVIHPTANLENPDELCDLDFVPGEAREMDVNVTLSNSFGFGGHNSTIVLRKFRG